MFELHYSTGGHGGPYATLGEAIAAAKALIRGHAAEHRIEIRDSVGGPLQWVVGRCRLTGDIWSSEPHAWE
jgi:hypothetical protein